MTPEDSAGRVGEPDQPTIRSTDEPTIESNIEPMAGPAAEPTDGSTAEPTVESTNEPTNEPTVSLSSDTPTTTGPTVASWPLGDLFQEPPPEVGPLVWRDPNGPPAPPAHQPAYYVALTVAVMLVLVMIAGLAALSMNPPVSQVAGTPGAPNIPDLPPPTNSTPPGATTTTAPPTSPAPGEATYAELAAHPLSISTATMPDQTCALPRFDPADAAQADFYQAAKACADNAFGALLSDADLPTTEVEVVTVQGGPAETPCGAVKPDEPATQCAGTVYMTPAHLRDTEGNDRFPGRYFGVFLREYGRAVLETGGMGELYENATDTEDLNTRVAQQATCLAGIASGAMSGRGAVDANITDEIRVRLSEVDSPPDADSWLDRGFQSRQLSACNSWGD
jgi:hypothetical protein